MKRKRAEGAEEQDEQREIVAAALAGDSAGLAALLGVAEGTRRHPRSPTIPERFSRPFAGCTPLAAAVLGGSPAVIKLLAAEVDVNQPQPCRPNEAALRAAFPELLSNSKLQELLYCFPADSPALHTALGLGLYALAEPLLEAGADVNLQATLGTPLEALNCGLQGGHLPEPAAAMLARLLEAGADPAQPVPRPFLRGIFGALETAVVEWLLQADASGRRQLSRAMAVMCLESAIRQHNVAAYPRLLVRVQGLQPPLDAAALRILLCLVARSGTPAMLRDMLALGADPTAPEAARLCLLAHAAMQEVFIQSDANESEGMVQALVAAKARLHLEDICCVAVQSDVPALKRLLRIGQPQPLPSVPWVSWLLNPFARQPLAFRPRLSCPVLLTLEEHSRTVRAAAGSSMAQFTMCRVNARLDMVEALGAAGYRPMRYRGTNREQDLGQHAHGNWQMLVDQIPAGEGEGPWQYDPLQDRPPHEFAVQGANRLLLFALERPQLGPGTLHRFPRRLPAAVRTMLLIAQHGKTHPSPNELSIEQLAALSCRRRQQAFKQVTDEGQRSSVELQSWAREHGWEPSGPGWTLSASATFWSGQWIAGNFKRREWGVPTMQRPGNERLEQMQAVERELDQRLMGGDAVLPALPLAAHPMRRLPADVLLHILRLAAYPLSAWTEMGDFTTTPAEAAGAEVGM